MQPNTRSADEEPVSSDAEALVNCNSTSGVLMSCPDECEGDGQDIRQCNNEEELLNQSAKVKRMKRKKAKKPKKKKRGKGSKKSQLKEKINKLKGTKKNIKGKIEKLKKKKRHIKKFASKLKGKAAKIDLKNKFKGGKKAVVNNFKKFCWCFSVIYDSIDRILNFLYFAMPCCGRQGHEQKSPVYAFKPSGFVMFLLNNLGLFQNYELNYCGQRISPRTGRPVVLSIGPIRVVQEEERDLRDYWDKYINEYLENSNLVTHSWRANRLALHVANCMRDSGKMEAAPIY